ncbi:MAG: helix-turn-helix domain-containing protein [Candidatus Methylomirabilales bacterium]
MTAARGDFLLRALEAGHRSSRIAAFLQCSPPTVSNILNRNL